MHTPFHFLASERDAHCGVVTFSLHCDIIDELPQSRPSWLIDTHG